MQQVEGSSPFSRFEKAPQIGGAFLLYVPAAPVPPMA